MEIEGERLIDLLNWRASTSLANIHTAALEYF